MAFKVIPVPPVGVTAARAYYDYELFDAEGVYPGEETSFFVNFHQFAKPQTGVAKIFGHHTNMVGAGQYLPQGYLMRPKSVVVDGLPTQYGVTELPKPSFKMVADQFKPGEVPQELCALECFKVVLPPVKGLVNDFLGYARIKGTLLMPLIG